MDHYIFFGNSPRLSPLRVIVRDGADDPSIEIRVLSSAVTGEDIKRFYDGLRERVTLPRARLRLPVGRRRARSGAHVGRFTC